MSANYYRMNGSQLWQLYRQHFKLLRECNPAVMAIQHVIDVLEASIAAATKKKGLLGTALEWVIGSPKKTSEEYFEDAVGKLDVFERIIYYCWLVDWLCGANATSAITLPRKMCWHGEFKGYGILGTSSECTIEAQPTGLVRINNLPFHLDCYLVRKSRSDSQLGIIFEPFVAHLEKYRVVFADLASFQECFVTMNVLIEKCHKQKFQQLMGTKKTPKGFSEFLRESVVEWATPSEIRIFKSEQSKIHKVTPTGTNKPRGSLKTFQEMMPECNIAELAGSDGEFRVVATGHNFKLMQNGRNPRQLKFITQLKVSREAVTEVLRQPDEMLWNGQVEASSLVSRKDESTFAVYHKLRMCSLEFLLVRHCFQYGTADFFLDKSVEPGQGSTYGQVVMRLMWVQDNQMDANSCWLSALAEVEYGPAIPEKDGVQLTQKYLLEILDLQAYCRLRQSTRFAGSATTSDYDRHYIQPPLPIQRPDEHSVVSEYNEQASGQADSIINDLALLQVQAIRQPNHLTQKHSMSPSPCLYTQPKTSIWGGECSITDEGLVFKPSPKLQTISNYYRYMLPRLLTDHSKQAPPIEVCSPCTLLQQIASSIGLAPLLLERAVQSNFTMDRFKHCVAFCMSLGVLSLRIDIPLKLYPGDTHQCWLNGCPLYMEVLQIHPDPLIAIFMQGRGYKLYGTYRQSVQFYSNQLLDNSQANYVVEFSKCRERVHLKAPLTCSDGLIQGHRSQALRDSCYCFDESSLLFAEMSFINKKSLWPFKHNKPLGTIEGEIRRISRQALDRFVAEGKKNRISQSSNVKNIASKISGQWTDTLLFDGIDYYKVNRDLPSAIEKEQHPLPSDSSLRPDMTALLQGNLSLAGLYRDKMQATSQKLK